MLGYIQARCGMEKRAFILNNTQVVAPLLCPEMRLHLITACCPLWHATEADLAALAIEDPYWGFCWAGGQALTRYILDNPQLVTGRRVLDFGAGCGIDAIAALKAGAASVLASDIDPLAIEAARLNAMANAANIATTTRDLLGDPLPEFDVVLVGDMFYDPVFSRRLLAWLVSLAADGLQVILSDPCRGNIAETSVRQLAVYQAPADVDISGMYFQKTIVYAVGTCLQAAGEVHPSLA